MLCNSKNHYGLPRGTRSGAKLYPAGSSKPRPLTCAFDPIEGWWEEWELEDEPHREPAVIRRPDGSMLVDRGRKLKVRNGPESGQAILRSVSGGRRRRQDLLHQRLIALGLS